MDMNVIHTAPHECPHCGAIHQHSLGMNVAQPHSGSVLLCVSCGAISIFTADMDLRVATPAELIGIRAGPVWKLITWARSILAEELVLRGHTAAALRVLMLTEAEI